jgi:hypothetical protein
MHASDIASHVLFWLSDQSFPCNGAIYVLNQYASFGRGVKKNESWQ